MHVAAVVLAAGRSERMGEPKALINWHGRPLLQYQLEQLAALDEVAEIIVVTGYAPERLREIIAAVSKAREAHNAAFDDGKAGSVRCGMNGVSDGADAVLLIAVDQPRPASFLRTLVDAHAAASPLITAPTFEGRRGHPLIFDRALLEESRAVDDATLGVRAVLDRHADGINDVATADPVARFDLNTPDDVARGLMLTAERP
jgi:CTP:molybdopterin cytidylyltransferase MocA